MEALRGVVVAVRIGIQGGVPERAMVRLVHEETGGERDGGDGVVVAPGGGIDGVRAVAGICVWALALFLGGCVGEGLAGCVLAVPDGFGGAVFEADHVVFPVLFSGWTVYTEDVNSPVPNMIPEFHAQHRVSQVIPVHQLYIQCTVNRKRNLRIEIKIKHIHLLVVNLPGHNH